MPAELRFEHVGEMLLAGSSQLNVLPESHEWRGNFSSQKWKYETVVCGEVDELLDGMIWGLVVSRKERGTDGEVLA